MYAFDSSCLGIVDS